jgi:hypothetical protein
MWGTDMATKDEMIAILEKQIEETQKQINELKKQPQGEMPLDKPQEHDDETHRPSTKPHK